LAERADVIIETFRPGVVARLGIGYDDVAARNPGIVYCSTSGFGQSGPHAQWAGHDINYLATTGYLDMTERGEGGKPPVPGATIADSTGGGMHAVMSICAALVGRSKTGKGAYLDVCIADGMLSIMALAADEYFATGVVPGPGHGLLTGRYACYDTYPAGDGRWLSFGAIEGRFWVNLCKALGLEQWGPKQYDDDLEVQAQIRADVRAKLATKSRDEWVALLAPADTCVAPVLDITEVVTEEQFIARGDYVDAVHPTQGTFRQVGALLAGQERPTEPYELSDSDSTDTDELLQAAGYSPADCVKLREAGVIS
jgi:alpha-methylacyl-CoA racemase